MVAAGVGANVAITLWIISEGRYEPQNFPVALFEDERLRWDRVGNTSNYEANSKDIMSRQDGRTWLLEASNPAQLPQGIWVSKSSGGFSAAAVVDPNAATPALADAYFAECASPSSSGGTVTPCPKEATPTVDDAGRTDGQGTSTPDASIGDAGGSSRDAEAGDAGDSGTAERDAATDASTTGDAGAPAGETASGRDPISPERCLKLDDLDVALFGLHRTDVWVTRVRAVLPVDALTSGDLRLSASKQQMRVSNVHAAAYYSDEDPMTSGRSACGSAPKEHRAYGSWVVGVLSSIFAVALVRRRRRR
jgi:hypothetical protein